MLTPLHAPPACPSETLCRAGHRHRGSLGPDNLVLTSLLLHSACSLLQRPSPSSRASPAWQRQGRKLPLHSRGSPGSARRKCQAQCPLPGEALHANDWALSGCNCHCRAGRERRPGEPVVWGGVGTELQWDRERELAFPVCGPGCEGTAVSKERDPRSHTTRGSRATAINPLARLAAQPLRPSRACPEMFPLTSQALAGEGLQRAGSKRPPSWPSLPLHSPAQPALQEPGRWHSDQAGPWEAVRSRANTY